MDEVNEQSTIERKLLNRNRFRYLLLISVAVIYAFFFGGFYPFTLLYFTLLIPLVSIISLLFTNSQLKLYERLNNRSFTKGEKASYQLQLNNDSIFPLPYVTVYMLLEGQTICSDMRNMRISLPPLSKKVFTYDMPLRFRGRYTIGVNYIEIIDLLGIIRLRIRMPESKTILVKPRILSTIFMKIPTAMVAEGNTKAGLYEQGQDETVNIREYRFGDSLRHMHWKLFAKMHHPMTREFKNELDNDIMLLINLNKPLLYSEVVLQQEDCLIEAVVSAAHQLILRGLPVRLCIYQNEPLVVRAQTPGDFIKIYETLSEVKFNQNIAFIDVMDYFLATGTDKTLMYIYTVTITGAIIDKALSIHSKGYDMEITYVTLPENEAIESNNAASITETLSKSGINACQIHPLPLESEFAQAHFRGGA